MGYRLMMVYTLIMVPGLGLSLGTPNYLEVQGNLTHV